MGEEVTPEQLVDAARDENSELHQCFEWDDSIAAEMYRKDQARKILRLLVIKQEETESKELPPVRYFFKTNNDGYKPSSVIFKKPDEYQALLQRALAELHAFKVKYSTLQELSEILTLID